MVVLLIGSVWKVFTPQGSDPLFINECELPESHRATRGLLVMTQLMVCISNNAMGIKFLLCFDFGVGMFDTIALISS